MGTIVASSLKLVIDTYYSNDPSTYSDYDLKVMNGLDIISYIINGIFIFEMIVKVIALGFVMDMNTYLRDSWNKLDFTIVSFSILDMVLSGSNLGFIKIVRMLRILRPLRFIS